MTPLFPAQRAAEEFDQALGGTATQVVVDRYADLLDTVEVLHAQPEVLPRTEFVSDLRSRLMTAAETELVAAPSVVRRLEPARATRNRRRIGSLAASLVIVGGSAGMAAAASGALPGEPLYPIKRGIEQINSAVRLSEVSEGEVLLDQAATRLDEVRSLQAQGSRDPALVADTLDSFRSAAEEGSAKLFTAYQANGETEDITTVRSFTSEHMAEVAALSSLTSDRTTDELLVDAADTLADIDQQARVLCRSCGSEAALAPPQALSATAGAATVENLLARPVSQAQLDIQQIEAARLAKLKAAASAAEKTAGRIPKITDPSGTGSTSGLPTIDSSQDGPVTSTITGDGQLLPALKTGGIAVKDLVTGVTGTLEGVTGTVTGSGTPLDSAVQGLTDTVDKTTDELLP